MTAQQRAKLLDLLPSSDRFRVPNNFLISVNATASGSGW